jgi:peptide subunit release factor 1 (eRF1)
VISESELQELAGLESQGLPVLSLYLDTDLTQQPKGKCRLVLRDLLDRVEGLASGKDLEKVQAFFDLEYDWQARGVVVFSAADQELWRVYPLAVPIESEIHSGDRFYLKPLTQLLDTYGRYGVILVDRESARFFLMHLGQIEKKSTWTGEDLKRHKQGGWSAARYQRHVDNLAEQNLKMAAEATTRFCRENSCRCIILGGSEETVSQFEEILPKALRKQVVGVLSVDVEAPAAEVMQLSTELIRSEEQHRAQNLVEDTITAAAKGEGAVTGTADTFYVAHEGRIHTLVVEKDFETDGYLCDGCGYISAEPITKCPFCGGKPRLVRKAVNRVVQRVLEAGGKVRTVDASEALEKAGHMGAILRY